MKKLNQKRIVSILLAVCMLIGMLPVGMIGAGAAEIGTVYSYKFSEVMDAYDDGVNSMQGYGSVVAESYDASQEANVGSAKWMYVTTSIANGEAGYMVNYSTIGTYGVFGLGNEGGSDWLRVKIEVPEDAQYTGTMNYYDYSGNSSVDVYLAPVDASDPVSSNYLLMNIVKGDTVGDRSATSSPKMITAGDYYLTVQQVTGSGRYFTHKSFDLTVVGAYDANVVEITAVEFDKTELFLGMDGIEFITPIIYPEAADDGTAVFEWASSDENVALIEDGLVMPVGPGTAVITATTAGKTASAYVLVTDQASFVYALDKGWNGQWSSSVLAFESITFANTQKGHAQEIKSNYRTIDTDPWAYESLNNVTAGISSSFPSTVTGRGRGYQFSCSTEGSAAVRVKVSADGTYIPSFYFSKGNGYGNVTFYIAPAGVINPTAAEYAMSDTPVSLQNDAGIIDWQSAEYEALDLTAGEYIISAVGTYPALFWSEIRLTNVNAVDSVSFARETLNVAVGETRSVAATVLPDTAPDKSVTYSSDNEEVVLVDETTGEITALTKGTAVITATSAADKSKSDSVTINVGDKIFYYNYMKSKGFGLTPAPRDDKYLKDSVCSGDFKYTISGSADEVATDLDSYGWKIGTNTNSTDWTWSESAVSLGLFVGLARDAENGSAQIIIDVPLDGTYTVSSVHSAWTGGTSADYYIAPVDAADPLAAEYKVNAEPINHLASTNGEVEEILGTVDLTAGEYIVSYFSATTSNLFLKGIKLTDAEINVPVESVSLNVVGMQALEIGGNLTATATVAPATASNQVLNWTSSNDSIASVVDGVVTGNGAGVATITATTTDGTELSASFSVMVGMQLTYTYAIRANMATLYNLDGKKANVSASKTDFAQSYAKSVSLGSDPWMYDSSNTGSGGEYFDYTSSSHGGNGVFAVYGGAGAWSRVKINVAEGAEYVGLLGVSDWTGSDSFDVYVAPTAALNPIAEEYKVASFTQSGGTNHGYKLAFDKQAMPAGDYYMTLVSTETKGSLIAIWSLELYKTGDLAAADEVAIDVSTTEGASIRTTGAQGLRFYSSIDKNAADFGEVIEYGTILLPTEDLNGDNSNLIIGYENNNHKVAKVPAVNIYSTENGVRTYTAVITNIAEANYTRAYSARAYAIYRDSNGNISVVYSDTVTSRSIYEVAQNGLADPDVSAEDAAIFQAIVDAVDGAAE